MAMAMANNNNNNKLRIFFIPFFASGHMIPMSDLAVLFSRHPDVEPTLCLTPANADFLRPSLPSSVTILTYPFPSQASGLPPGVENLSSVSRDQEWKIYKAVALSSTAHRDLLHQHRPDCVVADIPFWWTTDVARELGIPRITWHAVGVFPQLTINSLNIHRKDILGKDGKEVVAVRDFPGPEIRMPVAELPEFARSDEDHMAEIFPKLKKAQLEGYGVIVNTFYEFEPVYCDYYRETDCKRGWFVGPVALARAYDDDDKAGEEEDDDEWLSWLDGKEEGSVVFVCFGSWCYFKDEQLKEMAVGLEKSGRSFLWVVRRSDGDWLPDEEWEKRVEGKGKVVRGWAPQVKILGHRAVGAFLTHCGWNSVLESATAGVPMLTWPLVFEQFINERLVVEVMRVGERVSEGFRSTREEEKVVVPGEAIAKAVSRFLEEEEEEGSGGGGRRRLAARKLAEMARAAVAEGGSSWKDLKGLIDELRVLRDHNKLKEEQ